MPASSTYTVERSTVVQAEPARLFAEVEDFRRWPAWSPWEGIDPACTAATAGRTRGVGAVYAWSGNRKAGEGRMEITAPTQPTRVLVDLQFLKPFKSSSITTFMFAPSARAPGSPGRWPAPGPSACG